MSRLTADSRNYRWRRVSATEPPLSTPAKYLSLLPPREGGWRIFLEKESRKLPFGNCTVIASWRMCTYGRGSPFLSKILPNWPTAGQSKELCNCNCLFPPVGNALISYDPRTNQIIFVPSILERVWDEFSIPCLFPNTSIYMETIRPMLERYSVYSLRLLFTIIPWRVLNNSYVYLLS